MPKGSSMVQNQIYAQNQSEMYQDSRNGGDIYLAEKNLTQTYGGMSQQQRQAHSGGRVAGPLANGIQANATFHGGIGGTGVKTRSIGG